MLMGVDKRDPKVLSRCRAKDPSRCPYHTEHMDVTQAEASRWMEARAREEAMDEHRPALSKKRVGYAAAGRSLIARKTAGSERRSRVRKTLATVMAVVALSGCSFMGSAAPSNTVPPVSASYTASQAASKLDSASVIKMKRTSSKTTSLASVLSYDVEADGVKVASITLKPDGKAKSWDAVMESTDGGKMGSAEHKAADSHSITVEDTVDKQESTVSMERNESLFRGYRYKQTGDVEAVVSQSLPSLTTKHSLEGESASYDVKANWGGSEWTISEKAGPSSDGGDVDGVDAVMSTLAVSRDRAETRGAHHRGWRRVHRFHRG